MISKFIDLIYYYYQNYCDFLYKNKIAQLIIWISIGLGVFVVTKNIWFTFFTVILVVSFYKNPRFGVISLAVLIPGKYLLENYVFELIDTRLVIPLALIVLMVSCGTRSVNRKITSNNIDVILFLILVVYIFATCGNIILYGFRMAMILDFFVWLQLLGFYLLGKLALGGDNVRTFLFANLVIANIVSIIGVILACAYSGGYQPWIEPYETITYRATSVLGNPNALAGYLLLIILMSAIYYLRMSKNRALKGALILPVIALFLTLSRGAILVFVLSGLLYLIVEKKYKVLLLGVVLLMILFILLPNQMKQRFYNIFSNDHINYSMDSGRIWSLNNVFYINRNHYLFGNGWGSYGGEYAYKPLSPTYLEGVQGGNVTVPNTDNQWLQIYAQLGVTGLVLYLMVFIEITRITGFNATIMPLLAFGMLGIFIDVFQFYQVAFLGYATLGFLPKIKETAFKKIL